MTPITSRSGTPASALCFGTMQFGGKSSVKDAAEVFAQCRDAGVNFFDCANVYGDGLAEEILGPLARNNRDDLILTTKGGYWGGAGGELLLSQLDDSLARLGTDYVDVYFLHRWDQDVPLEETYDALATMKQAGKIGLIGVSNYAAWQVMKAQTVAKQRGIAIDLIQPMYNLVKRQAEVELLPMALSEGLSVTPYSPLAGGLLTGKYRDATARGRLIEDDRYSARYAVSWMKQCALDLADLAGDLGCSPATLAVSWVKQNPAITAPIISGRTSQQLAPSLAALNNDLSKETLARITALSRTPAPATDRLEEV